MKWFGEIGYGIPVEMRPGVVVTNMQTQQYYGDVIKNSRGLTSNGKINDDLNVTNQISIIADHFSYTYFHAIRYVTWMGNKWKVSSVEVQMPRLILTLGGLYNESTESP